MMLITEEYLRTLANQLLLEERDMRDQMMVKQGARKVCEFMLQRLEQPEPETEHDSHEGNEE